MFGITIKQLVIFIFIVTVDLAIYVILGIFLMRYDDFYDESKGAYGSWESMDALDKGIFSGLTAWNIINVIAVGFLLYWIYKKIKAHNKTRSNSHKTKY